MIKTKPPFRKDNFSAPTNIEKSFRECEKDHLLHHSRRLELENAQEQQFMKERISEPSHQFFRLGDGQIDSIENSITEKNTFSPTLQKPENHAIHHMTPECHHPRPPLLPTATSRTFWQLDRTRSLASRSPSLLHPLTQNARFLACLRFLTTPKNHIISRDQRPPTSPAETTLPRGPTNSGYVRSFLQPSNAAPINRADVPSPPNNGNHRRSPTVGHLQDLDRQINVPDHVLLRDKYSHSLPLHRETSSSQDPFPVANCSVALMMDKQSAQLARNCAILVLDALLNGVVAQLGCNSQEVTQTGSIVSHRGSERIAVFVRGRSFSRECVAFATTDCPNMKIWHRWDPPIERLLFLERLLQLGIDKTKRAPKIPKLCWLGGLYLLDLQPAQSLRWFPICRIPNMGVLAVAMHQHVLLKNQTFTNLKTRIRMEFRWRLQW